MPAEVEQRLRCPRDAHAPLTRCGDRLRCTAPDCGLAFPIVDGTPILIDETRCLFSVEDFMVEQRTTLDLRDESQRERTLLARLKSRLGAAVPGLSVASSDFDEIAALAEVERTVAEPTVLVIGAGDVRFEARPGTTIVYSDVARGPLIHLIADAHDLPFADSSFDAVLAIAVVQYLSDPVRAVEGMHRVLKPGGYVYVVAPMIQQNTLGPFDHFLFTHAGLRRLMRRFEELRTGVANGPAMALSWTIESFVSSFSEARRVRSILRSLTRLLIWPLKYLDRFLSRKRGAYDCASAFYFFGRRSDVVVTDRAISRGYRGLNWSSD